MGLDIIHFLHSKTLLVTGATGFLAKVFVEKVLRIQPNIKKMYLLIKAEDTNSALKRLHREILDSELFNFVAQRTDEHAEGILESIRPVRGDISSENIGINDSELREEMWKEVEIIVNVAATTSFDERYDVALVTNTFGGYHLMNFAKKCAKAKIFLHVPTAYVCGEKEGLISEKAFCMGETLDGSNNLDIEHEKQIVEKSLSDLQSNDVSDKEIKISMKKLGLQRAEMYGWPNTYSFTKAMGEMLLGKFRGDIPLVILRPTIITSINRDILPGWIEKLRTFDWLAIAYAQGKIRYFLADPSTTLDVIPADMVVNAMIVALAIHANNTLSSSDRNIIYHVGSSSVNPFRLENLHFLGKRYFKEHPWVDENGKPIRPGGVKLLKSTSSFRKYLNIHYLPLLKILKWTSSTCCPQLKGSYVQLKKKFDAAIRLADLYKPYVSFKGILDDSNIRALRVTAEKEGVDIENLFNFNPKNICWEDYFMKIHFPGIVRAVQSN